MIYFTVEWFNQKQQLKLPVLHVVITLYLKQFTVVPVRGNPGGMF